MRRVSQFPILDFCPWFVLCSGSVIVFRFRATLIFSIWGLVNVCAKFHTFITICNIMGKLTLTNNHCSQIKLNFSKKSISTRQFSTTWYVSTDVNHCDFSKLIFSTIYFNTLDRNKALPLFTTRFWSSAFKGFDFSHVIYFFHKSFWEVSKGFDEGGQAGRERLKPWVTDSHSFKQLEHS